ncbi:MAG: hypothetical protein Q9177_004406 [Variospora cf. flavescens]
MSTEATAEFASTWMCVRRPSPPKRSSTFVTAVPARKKTTRRVKKTLQGCMAWTTAVKVAAAMPAGVRESRE